MRNDSDMDGDMDVLVTSSDGGHGADTEFRPGEGAQ